MIITLFNTINARLKLTWILPSRQPYTTVTSILEVGLLPSRQVNAGSFTAQYRYIYWLFSPDCGLQDYCIQYVSVVQKGGHKTFNKINLSLFVSDVYGIQINFPNNIPTMWAYNILLTASC